MPEGIGVADSTVSNRIGAPSAARDSKDCCSLDLRGEEPHAIVSRRAECPSEVRRMWLVTLVNSRTGISARRFSVLLIVTLCAWLALASAAHAQVVSPAPAVAISEALQNRIGQVVRDAIRKHEIPGAVVAIGIRDRTVFHHAYGSLSVQPVLSVLPPDAVFDLASLTKAVATAPSVLQLAADRRIALDDPVARYLPAFGSKGKEAITVRQLLTHTSGLPDDNALQDYRAGREAAVRAVFDVALRAPPGQSIRYSDVGFIVLGELVAHVSGRSLATFARERTFDPLGMSATGFSPELAARASCVPTTFADGAWLRGVVHDPRARAMQGEAGHAGLFSTANDLSRFARMLLGGGSLDGVRVLPPDAVSVMFTPLDEAGGERTMGLNVRRDASAVWCGHEGFTGTALWVEPRRGVFLVVLSSRLNPDGKGNVHPTVRALRALALEASDALGSRPIGSADR